jgi:Uma2 family endonuclease
MSTALSQTEVRYPTSDGGLVIEISSKSTKQEDLKKKFELYRDVL